MLSRLGLGGVFGLLVVASGLGLIALVNPLIAAGISVMLFGLGITVQSIVSRTIAQFRMAGGLAGGEN